MEKMLNEFLLTWVRWREGVCVVWGWGWVCMCVEGGVVRCKVMESRELGGCSL